MISNQLFFLFGNHREKSGERDFRNRFGSYHGRLILITSIDDLFLNKRGLLDVFDEQVHVFLLHACLNNYVLPETAGTENGKLLFSSFPLQQHVAQKVRKNLAEKKDNL